MCFAAAALVLELLLWTQQAHWRYDGTHGHWHVYGVNIVKPVQALAGVSTHPNVLGEYD